MTRRKRTPKPRESTLALGRICGCDRCKYCEALSAELTVQAMVKEVSRGKQIAEAHREELLNKWRKQ
jgi:hypothetical protein